MMLGGIAILLVVVLLFPLDPWLVAETSTRSGPIELVQFAHWIGAGVVASVSVFIGGLALRDRAMRAWFAIISFIFGAREADLHERLNPDNLVEYGLDHLGVRYKMNWWTDGSVPLWIKLAWAVFFVTTVAAVVVPIVFAKPPVGRLLRSGCFAVQCMVVGWVCLLIGYAADDLVGRGQFVSREASGSVEEVAELLGAVLWALGVCLWTRVRLEPTKPA